MLPRVFALLLTDCHRIIVAPLARYAAVVGPWNRVGYMPWKRVQ